MTAVSIALILGFCGLAIDLGMVLNRKVELQTAADTIALAAAKELDGTDAGVTRAATVAGQMAANIFYSYNASSVDWAEKALSFGATPYGATWHDASSAATAANAPNMYYARVDTAELDAGHGKVALLLLRLLPSVAASVQVSSTATAGRASINVMPLAVCALSETPALARGGELVQYGFRRGITYDLMQLNSEVGTTAAHYLVNPVALAGTSGSAVAARMDVVRPFVCTGTLAIPSLAGGKITVERNFPLGSVFEQINSRFGSYTVPPCTATTAPPDTSVKEFTHSTEFPWMNDTPEKQGAELATTATHRFTIADLPSTALSPSTEPKTYGPLWIYAKAARYTTAVEPGNGYPTFNPTTTDWATLYSPGPPKIKSGKSYPGTTPYVASLPTPTTVSNARRVLNVPLLRCPVPAGSPAQAEVAAIAKFFLPIKASATHLYGEFAGIAPQTSLTGEVELYP